MLMLDKLKEIESRYEILSEQLGSPEVVSDNQQYQKAAKALSELTPIVDKFRSWKRIDKGIADATAMLQESDPDLRAMAQGGLGFVQQKREEDEADLKLLLVPKDPN